MRSVLLVVLLAALGGCINVGQMIHDHRMQEIQASTPICRKGPECDAMWASAKDYVEHKCGLDILTETDTRIDTEKATDGDTATECHVTREDLDADRQKIVIFPTTGWNNPGYQANNFYLESMWFNKHVNHFARTYGDPQPPTVAK